MPTLSTGLSTMGSHVARGRQQRRPANRRNQRANRSLIRFAISPKPADSSNTLEILAVFPHYLGGMLRNQRCVLPGHAYHITQRGTNRPRVFFTDSGRSTCLRLMLQNLNDAGVRVLAWCLMDNHVHFVVVPERENPVRAALLERPEE